MKSDFWLDPIPLWGAFLLTVVIVLLSIRMGVLLGNRRRRQPEHETDVSLGTSIGATLRLLAFTFGFAADRLQARRQLLLDEVNTIGTTYLRAGLLLEPHQSEIRRLLREYVDLRANLARENLSRQWKKIQEALSRLESLQDQMWSHAVAIVDVERYSPIDALFISSFNEMTDLQNSRLAAIRQRIPTSIWNTLYLIAILSMGTVGYQAGLSSKSSLRIGLVLALTFSAVVLLIADLDRVTEGSLRVDQRLLLELQKKMQTPEAQTGDEQISSEPDEPAPRERLGTSVHEDLHAAERLLARSGEGLATRPKSVRSRTCPPNRHEPTPTVWRGTSVNSAHPSNGASPRRNRSCVPARFIMEDRVRAGPFWAIRYGKACHRQGKTLAARDTARP